MVYVQQIPFIHVTCMLTQRHNVRSRSANHVIQTHTIVYTYTVCEFASIYTQYTPL